jgi:hypothetical protein
MRPKINNMINLSLRPEIVLLLKNEIFRDFSKKIKFTTGIIVTKDMASKNVISTRKNKIRYNKLISFF